MIVATSDAIPGKNITEVLGLVQASSARTRAIGRDIMAFLRTLVGGEVPEYTKLMAQSREQAVQRLISVAQDKGANAIVGTRFMTSMIAQGTAEILVYGTAVTIEGA